MRANFQCPWTGSTNFEESTSYKDEVHDVDEEDPQQAKPARGSQHQHGQHDRKEQSMNSHIYLSEVGESPTCVANKGRAGNHPKQTSKMPVVQFDFCHFKTAGEPTTTANLTGSDVETGMVMATMVDKQQDFQLIPCQLHPIIPHGMRQSTSSTQQHHLTIRSRGSPDSTPTHSSKQDGRQHHHPAVTSIQLTSTRQDRTVPSNTDGTNQNTESQLQQNYDRTSTSKHPIVPWLVRYTAYLLNRYATHADGNASFFRRWNKDHRTPLCEFRETAQYLLPTMKQLPKMEQRFFGCPSRQV